MIAFLVALMLMAQSAHAQVGTAPASSSIVQIIPAPLVELWNVFERISALGARIGENVFTREIVKIIPRSGAEIGQRARNALGWFERVNAWFENVVGVRLTKLFQLVGNILVWMLEALTRLLRIGLTYIE